MIDKVVRDAAEKLGVELRCNICGSTKNRLVRDHRHHSGMIRGILCELCNSWLGVYEANMCRIVEKGKKAYRKWVATYFDKIEAHLKIHTNVRYDKHNRVCDAQPNARLRSLKGVVF